jgi:hypothetical protein
MSTPLENRRFHQRSAPQSADEYAQKSPQLLPHHDAGSHWCGQRRDTSAAMPNGFSLPLPEGQTPIREHVSPSWH